ncbi:hypothetical protein FHR81_003725 [Actinoalloteichus hoggarensis]|uniref:Uncharacterized protein n=1 Tax=Actinoalloteichus hoggarensis TaxID=1470176 RepID=A0A221WBQ0_9PSEU|nr:hypothetical protein [Actinoalloteichus hoggarensis]ASO23063.1 hypothetical protein AHOG_27325 [Actinoalloteichus hoggarensis]MBB5922668.1 hypothetical protein [Actinoalloteichus hoggarensis]
MMSIVLTWTAGVLAMTMLLLMALSTLLPDLAERRDASPRATKRAAEAAQDAPSRTARRASLFEPRLAAVRHQ